MYKTQEDEFSTQDCLKHRKPKTPEGSKRLQVVQSRTASDRPAHRRTGPQPGRSVGGAGGSGVTPVLSEASPPMGSGQIHVPKRPP